MILVDTDECIEWTGTIDVHGYGAITFDGRKQKAHRVAYALAIGDPTGKNVLHRCDNTKCINPNHLYLGTQQENARDMMVRRRHVNPWSRKIADSSMDAALAAVRSGESQGSASRRFGISQSMLSLMLRGKRRKLWPTEQ